MTSAGAVRNVGIAHRVVSGEGTSDITLKLLGPAFGGLPVKLPKESIGDLATDLGTVNVSVGYRGATAPVATGTSGTLGRHCGFSGVNDKEASVGMFVRRRVSDQNASLRGIPRSC